MLFTHQSYLVPYNDLGDRYKKGKRKRVECYLNAIKCVVDVKGGSSHTPALLHEVVGRCIVAQHGQHFLSELPFLDVGRRCGFRPLED